MSKSQFQKEYEEYKKYKDWQEILGCKNAEEVIDFVMSNYLTEDEKCRTIAYQLQQIKELEHRLANCIEPKFKIGQEVYKVYTKNQRFPFKVKIIGFKVKKTSEQDIIFYDTSEDGFEMGWYTEEILFATEKEAKKKLEELENG